MSLDRLAQPNRSTGSHGRTDGRTNEEVAPVDLSGADPNAHATRRDFDIDRMAPLGPPPRFPVIRTGEREPIPWPVRCAIYYRDEGTCQLCGAYRPKPSQLDHVIPWSAGGSDRSDNLRLTCEPCNQRRSNYHELRDSRARRPVTWWCSFCYTPDGLRCHHEGHCRIWTIGRNGDTGWHSTEPVDPESATVFAFCAHCDAYGYTEARCVL